MDALEPSPCAETGVSTVAADADSAENGKERSCIDGVMEICSQDESQSRNLVKYGELVILG